MTAVQVAYLVRRYPLLSQTFVRNEIDEARRQDLDLTVCSLERGDDCSEAQPDLLMDGRWDDADLQRAAQHFRRRHPLRWRRFRRVSQILLPELGRGPGRVDHRMIPPLALDLDDAATDVLHAHFGWQAATAAWLASTLMDRPWSMTLHANDVFAKPRSLLPKMAAAERVVTVCDYNRDWIRSELGVTRPVDLVICGVEIPPSAERVDSDVDIVCVGRLVEKKGVDILIRAAAELRADRPSLAVEIVGDGPLLSELVALRDELGLAEVVRFSGALDHARALDRIASGRIFCLPCRIASDGDRDSMPVVIKEAMARAVPVVATAAVAVPEMIDDTCGRLVPPDDAGCLAAALAELLDDPALARSLGAVGRSRAAERFALSGEVAKLLRVFAAMGPATQRRAEVGVG